jgi:hypothetical protein
MSRLVATALVVGSVLALAHATYAVLGSRDAREAGSVSVAVSQFDLADGVSDASRLAAAAELGGAAAVVTPAARLARTLVVAEVIIALLCSVVGVALLAGKSVRAAQRVEVNAVAPHSPFDSCVYSGADFATFNHRARRVARGSTTSR